MSLQIVNEEISFLMSKWDRLQYQNDKNIIEEIIITKIMKTKFQKRFTLICLVVACIGIAASLLVPNLWELIP